MCWTSEVQTRGKDLDRSASSEGIRAKERDVVTGCGGTSRIEEGRTRSTAEEATGYRAFIGQSMTGGKAALCTTSRCYSHRDEHYSGGDESKRVRGGLASVH